MLVNLVEQFKRPKNLSVPQKGIVMYNDEQQNLDRLVASLPFPLAIAQGL